VEKRLLQLPKLHTRVRFPSPAPSFAGAKQKGSDAIVVLRADLTMEWKN
jgi:hypothetical protein